jgi:lysophospholipase L1-like esterase
VVDVAPLGNGAWLRGAYDGGDGLHLNTAGQRRLGQLIAATIRGL